MEHFGFTRLLLFLFNIASISTSYLPTGKFTKQPSNPSPLLDHPTKANKLTKEP